MKSTIENRKARHDYFIEDEIECGISLKGNEVKSIISGKCNLTTAWCSIEDNQLIIHDMYIAKNETTNTFDTDERRNRVLLAHKYEILKLKDKISQKGYTLVPIKMYWSKQHCKISVGICKGKHTYDKRNSLKEKAMERDIDRASKNNF